MARASLEKSLQSIDPQIEISAHLDQVKTTVEWLRTHSVDLIFLDIHLADQISFKIFDQVKISTPIIFTTAYDQYAIRAFKVNSIDYLLKPIVEDELRAALHKYHATMARAPEWSHLIEYIDRQERHNFQKRFLVKRGEKLLSVKTEDVAFFEGEDRYVYLVKRDGQKYFVDHKLGELEGLLDPLFFRLNRSFICHYDAIEGMLAVSKSRVKVNLRPKPSREIIVSTENTRFFKSWLNK